ncbi:EpsG family protein [Leclercia adecarboxylata]|uniref:EpsG family protein n=1 Tax=Leclercia adecarboxylata TaxID=83655 RepID=UPI00254C35EC|nr:EpsG family protein [Leclercia adecarboxylata]
MSLSKMISYYVFFILTIWLFYSFDQINYDQSNNPDILNYFEDYTRQYWNYDIGYELFVSFFRDYLDVSFDFFWMATLIVITTLFFFANFKAICLIFIVTNFYFLAPIMGAQVRYFMAVGFFVCLMKYVRPQIALLLLLPVCFLHYGVFIAYFIFAFTFYFSNNITVNKLLSNRLVVISVVVCSILFLQSAITFLIPYTRFAYYLDSFYLEGKSLTSIIYAVLSFYIIYCFYQRFINHSTVNNKDKILVLFGVLLSLLVVITSPIAVLSGRYLLFYIFMESLIAGVVIKYDRKTFLFIMLVSVSKWVSIINSGNLN